MKYLKKAINNFATAPYVYSYPPTSAYKPLKEFSSEYPLFSSPINIYIHIPFCEQKCTFCGYLTTVAKSANFQDDYTDCVVKEIGMYRKVIENKIISSVNFGGGTPSLLTARQFEKIMNALVEINPSLRKTAGEISIEATPESVDSAKINAWKISGLNRVSIGTQTLDNQEIRLLKRHNFADSSIRAITALRDAGISNICCDLMYGLSGQSQESWQKSVEGLAEFRPETIELYNLVVIPGTPLYFAGGSQMGNKERLCCYEFARTRLIAAGYAQDCHLRFIIPGKGFYLQQANVFSGQSLIGFGSGARSYADNMHFRNTFDSRNHRQSIRDYMETINAGNSAVASGVLVSPEETMRRYIIYNIEHLCKDDFRKKFGIEFEAKFSQEYQELTDLGLADDSCDLITLTPKGIAFRDVIANRFFSEAISVRV